MRGRKWATLAAQRHFHITGVGGCELVENTILVILHSCCHYLRKSGSCHLQIKRHAENQNHKNASAFFYNETPSCDVHFCLFPRLLSHMMAHNNREAHCLHFLDGKNTLGHQCSFIVSKIITWLRSCFERNSLTFIPQQWRETTANVPQQNSVTGRKLMC